MLSTRTAILGLVALILAALFLLRGAIGRSHPGVPAYYSFDSHAFTFNNSYTSGSVGPFTIGYTKAESIASLDNSGILFRLPMAMAEDQLEEFYFRENSGISSAMRNVLLGNSTWRISTSAQGANVVYWLVFNNDRLVSIRLTSTLAV